MTTPALPERAGGALAIHADQVEWTPTQLAALSAVVPAGAPSSALSVLLHVCQRTGLDPYRRQVYLIPEDDGSAVDGVSWRVQTGIDGFRTVCERHPQFAGPLGVRWCGPDGDWREVWTEAVPPVAARYGVVRRDWEQPVFAVAHFSEYAQRHADGSPYGIWRHRPAGQLGKCAEALARRMACPDQLTGIYTDDEMAHTRPIRVDNSDRQVVEHVAAGEAASADDEPDWDALLAEADELDDPTARLDSLWALARAIRPADLDLQERIAAAQEQARGPSPEEKP